MLDTRVPQYSLLALPSQYLSLADTQIHYCVLGEGPPLVLLHGLGSSCADWFPIAPGLAAHYKLILIDLRGHGQSSLAYTGDYAVSHMADDVARVLDFEGIEHSHVLGLSLGGCVAMQLALAHSKRVDHLILVNTFARLRGNGWRMIGQRLSRVYASLKDMDKLSQIVAASLFEDADLQAIVQQRIRRNDLGAMRRAMISVVRFNVLDQLGRLQAPALVLIGDRDHTVPRRCAYEMMARLPRARLRVIPDAGHALPYDQPDAFLKITLDYLAESRRRATAAHLSETKNDRM